MSLVESEKWFEYSLKDQQKEEFFRVSDLKEGFYAAFLTLFPLGGGHGVSLHIQIISFQIWIELHG